MEFLEGVGSRIPRRMLGTILLTCTLASAAHAQWTAVILDPAGSGGSFGYGVSSAHQGGMVILASAFHAALWSGTAAGWVDLNPAAATDAAIFGLSGDRQVGFASFGGSRHASLWSGTAASWVDLNPAGASQSEASRISGGQQAGYAFVGLNKHAGIWNGSAGTWVDLNPAGTQSSIAYDVFGGQQCGVAGTPGPSHAGFWSGTAASWVDLNPAGASASEADGISAGQQVGVATVGPNVAFDRHASLWSGTAASWVDLNPPGGTTSGASGVSGGVQVGFVSFGTHQRAYAWSGTAASGVDLHALLPGRYSQSSAVAVWTDASGSYAVGSAFDSLTSNEAAVLWTKPAPPALVVLSPAGATASRAYGVADHQQAGYSFESGAYRASLWSGTSASWLDITPVAATDAFVYGMGDGQQVGVANVGGLQLASLWSGTASSWVSLDPGIGSSRANAVSGGHQVGHAFAGVGPHASLWSGTPGSWVDLNPAGATQSDAYGVSGAVQAGVAHILGADHAGTWNGSAGSWVDLNPLGSSNSAAYGIGGGQQVGYANFSGVIHASLWTGTSASWTDLAPAGSTESYAYGAYGGQQVGQALVGGVYRASLWNGGPGTWLDLHALLPAGYSVSAAQGIWSDGTYTYVAGWGHSTLSGHDEAILWTIGGALLTATVNTPVGVTVETAANGSGTALATQSLPSGASLTVYAITRNTAGAFLANVAATNWSLQGVTGGVVPADLVPAGDGRSAAFTGHAAGSAAIQATAGITPAVPSGTVTVTTATGVDDTNRPFAFALHPNSPNPFGEATTIRFTIPRAGHVSLKVFDVHGREVATLVDRESAAGSYDVRWETTALKSGAYFYRLESGGRRDIRKMVRLR